MPFYPPLKIQRNDSPEKKEWKRFTANRLISLRAALRDHIFANREGESRTHDRDDQKWLRIATWNIREFDSEKFGGKFKGEKFEGRMEESFFYIAEIISHFDLVAVQEVREDLTALRRVMRILGSSNWNYIATDVTEGASGNSERMVFVYNRNKVRFKNVAGEITLEKKRRISFPHDPHLQNTKGMKLELPAGKKLLSPKNIPIRTYRGKKKLNGDLTIPLPDDTKVVLPKGCKLFFPDGFEVTPAPREGKIELPATTNASFSKDVLIDLPKSGLAGDSLQFARTPFLVSFQAGWLKFILCTVHIYYGKGKKGLGRRNAEIRKLTKFLAERAASEKDSDADNFFFALGDFNIVGKHHATWDSLHSNDFCVPEELKRIPEGSNVKQDKAYDQIAYWKGSGQRRKGNADIDVGHAGIFDFFKYVFRMGEDDPNGEDEARYSAAMGRSNVTYKEWRTYQMSDHLPMWMEMRIDFGDDYLKKIAR